MIMAAKPAIRIASNADVEMARLQAKFGEYLAMTSGTRTGLMRKKMTDVTIRVSKMFGMLSPGKRKRSLRGKRVNLIWFEFEKRNIAGRGIKVANRGLLSRKKEDKHGRPLSNWQRAVAREISSRVSGSGYLAFQAKVARKWRPKKSMDTHHKSFTGRYNDIVAKRFGDELQEVYEMRVPGTEKMNNRYGVVGRALRQVTADIEIYLRYKHKQIARQTLERRMKYGTGAEIKASRIAKKVMLGQSSAARKASMKAYRMALAGR